MTIQESRVVISTIMDLQVYLRQRADKSRNLIMDGTHQPMMNYTPATYLPAGSNN